MSPVSDTWLPNRRKRQTSELSPVICNAEDNTVAEFNVTIEGLSEGLGRGLLQTR